MFRSIGSFQFTTGKIRFTRREEGKEREIENDLQRARSIRTRETSKGTVPGWSERVVHGSMGDEDRLARIGG